MFDQLSDFLLLHIFEHLDVVSLVACQCSCKRCYTHGHSVLENSSSIITGINYYMIFVTILFSCVYNDN